MKLRKNDEVIIITGRDKGKTGKILEILPKEKRVRVAGIQMVKKHQKPTQQNTEGGIKEKEGTIHISNISLVTKGKNGSPTKIGYKVIDGKKKRVAKLTGKEI